MATISGTRGNDILRGTIYDDLINGNRGNDQLFGGAGNDNLTGYAGNDLIFGEAGNDYVNCTVFAGGDVVDGGAGFDTVEFSNRFWHEFTRDFTVMPVTLDLVRAQVSFGADLHRLRGVEYVMATGNPDLHSTVSAASATRPVTINLATGQVVGVSTGIVKISRFQDVTGGRAGDVLTGEATQNLLDGGAGADTLRGNAGGDAYIIDNVSDRAFEVSRSDTDLVVSRVAWTLDSFFEWLFLTGSAASGIGNTAANWIVGSAVGGMLNGRDGDDMLWARDGNDTLVGGSGADLMRGDGGNDTYFYVAGDGNDVISDGSGADTLVLSGLSLADVAAWHAVDPGQDGHADGLLVRLANGGSILIADYFAAGNPGSGLIETITLQGSGQSLAFADVQALVTAPDAAALALVAEAATAFDLQDLRLKTGAFAPTLSLGPTSDKRLGTSAVDKMSGGAGHDTLTGQINNDIIYGGDGNDILHGVQGFDALFGGKGDDRLFGGQGVDIVAGGPGNDTYYVDGSDVLYEEAGEGIDIVVPTVSMTLGEDFEQLLMVGTQPLSGSGNKLGNVMLGNAGRNTLSGLAGADLLDGGAAADILFGGADADQFVYRRIGDTGTTLQTADRIMDFSFAGGDRLSLLGIDANGRVAGDQAFVFKGTAAFTGAGQVRYAISGSETLVYLNGDADLAPEAMIRISGVHHMTKDWIFL